MDDQNNTQLSNSDFQSTDDRNNVVNITDTRNDPLDGAGIDPNTGDITDGARESFRGETSVGGANKGNIGVVAQGDAVDAAYNKETDTDTDTDTDDPGVTSGYRDSTGVYSSQNAQFSDRNAVSHQEFNTEDITLTNNNREMVSDQNQDVAIDDHIGANLSDLEGQGTAANDGDLQEADEDTSRKNFNTSDHDDTANYLVNE